MDTGVKYVVGQLISFYDFDQNQAQYKKKPLEMQVEIQDLNCSGSNSSAKYEKVLYFDHPKQFILVQVLANTGSEYEEDQYIVFFTCQFKQIIMTDTDMGRIIVKYCIEPSLNTENIIPQHLILKCKNDAAKNKVLGLIKDKRN